MNIIMKEDLYDRILATSKNGDPIGQWIADALKSGKQEEVFRGNENNFRSELEFDSGVLRNIKVRFSSINMNNAIARSRLELYPDTAYTDSGSSCCDLSKFISKFKNFPESLRTDANVEAFGEAMKVGCELKAVISDDLYDFRYAYSHTNYAKSTCIGHDDNDTLNHSCMQKTYLNERVAGFYKYIGHCKIMVVTNPLNQVVGRAIIWPEVNFVTDSGIVTGSLLSRTYYTSVGVKNFIFHKAKEAGINFRVARQELHCRKEFVVLNTTNYSSYEGPRALLPGDKLNVESARTKLYSSYQFAGGCPFVDVFTTFALNTEDGQLYLVNGSGSEFESVAGCCSTDGHSDQSECVCPLCGAVISDDGDYFCHECRDSAEDTTALGTYSYMPWTEIPGYGNVPIPCTEGEDLTSIAKVSDTVNRLACRGDYDVD